MRGYPSTKGQRHGADHLGMGTAVTLSLALRDRAAIMTDRADAVES